MKKFLSIDWDFFIDADFDQRSLLFPDGGDENSSLSKYIWDSLYRNPELTKVGVSDYGTLLTILNNFSGQCYFADSHRYAYDFIMDRTSPDEEFEVYNIDFHHDLYNYRTGNERVNCGNWGTILREDRPNMKFIWVKKPDSDPMTIGNFEVDCDMWDIEQFREYIKHNPDFDFLYMCRSSIWSPPHLDKYFIRALRTLKSHNINWSEEDVVINLPRIFEVSPDFTE